MPLKFQLDRAIYFVSFGSLIVSSGVIQWVTRIQFPYFEAELMAMSLCKIHDRRKRKWCVQFAVCNPNGRRSERFASSGAAAAVRWRAAGRWCHWADAVLLMPSAGERHSTSAMHNSGGPAGHCAPVNVTWVTNILFMPQTGFLLLVFAAVDCKKYCFLRFPGWRWKT